MNIRSLRFQYIRECVTIWGLILRSLGCSADICKVVPNARMVNWLEGAGVQPILGIANTLQYLR